MQTALEMERRHVVSLQREVYIHIHTYICVCECVCVCE